MVSMRMASLERQDAIMPGTHRVLLVEDDPLHARLAQMFLSDPGDAVAGVDLADNLARARACLTAAEYDAILLDLGLPDGQGLGVLQAVLSAAPGVPVLVVTGDDDQALSVEAMRLGAQDFLVKGRLDRKQLRSAVAYAMERKRLLRTGLAEGMLEGVLASSHNAVLALKPGKDRDGRFWRVILANPSCESFFDRTVREIEGARLDAVLPPRRYAEIEPVLATALEHGAVRHHQLCLMDGDSGNWLLMDAVPCGENIAVTLTDITPMKARESELVAAQKLAQSALDDKVGLLHALG